MTIYPAWGPRRRELLLTAGSVLLGSTSAMAPQMLGPALSGVFLLGVAAFLLVNAAMVGGPIDRAWKERQSPAPPLGVSPTAVLSVVVHESGRCEVHRRADFASDEARRTLHAAADLLANPPRLN